MTQTPTDVVPNGTRVRVLGRMASLFPNNGETTITSYSPAVYFPYEVAGADFDVPLNRDEFEVID